MEIERYWVAQRRMEADEVDTENEPRPREQTFRLSKKNIDGIDRLIGRKGDDACSRPRVM